MIAVEEMASNTKSAPGAVTAVSKVQERRDFWRLFRNS